MNTFSIGAALGFGWETFKKRPGFLIGASVCGVALSWLASAVSGAPAGTSAGWSVVTFLVSLALSTLVSMGITAFILRAHDDIARVSLNDLWHPQPFWNYLGAVVLVGIVTITGFVLLIIPGIIATLMFAFTKYIVIDHGMEPVEAMKESARITHGARWQILLFFFTLIGLNILGALALGIGLLVTGPVSMLAMVHVYRTLARTAPKTHPNTSAISA